MLCSCKDEFELIRLSGEAKVSEINRDNEFSIICPIEINASPIDGYDKFYDDIKSRMKFPFDKDNPKGKVYVGFNIDQNGDMSSVEVIRGVNEELDKEALRLIKSSTAEWKAGHVGDIKVNQRIVIPISF